jgi:hypothetical protein
MYCHETQTLTFPRIESYAVANPECVVFMFAPCFNSGEKSFIVPTDALNNIKPQL